MTDWIDIVQWFVIGFITAILMTEIANGEIFKAAISALLIMINLLSFLHRYDRKRNRQ